MYTEFLQFNVEILCKTVYNNAIITNKGSLLWNKTKSICTL